MTPRGFGVLITVVVLLAAVAPMVTATSHSETTTSTDITPGQRLSAAIGAQEAAVRGGIDIRVLLRQLATAETNTSRAEILNQTITSIRDRITAIETAQAELEAQYDNGTIPYGQYVAQTAQLIAQEQALRGLLASAAAKAERLPEAIRDRHGVNQTAITELRQRAQNATGSVVAETARELAGPPVDLANRSPGAGRGPPDNVGPPGQGSEALRTADRAVQRAEQQVAITTRLLDDGEAEATIADARATLNEAQSALRAARSAAAAGDNDRATELAERATDRAETAIELARTARQEAAGGGPPDTGEDDEDEDEDEDEDALKRPGIVL